MMGCAYSMVRPSADDGQLVRSGRERLEPELPVCAGSSPRALPPARQADAGAGDRRSGGVVQDSPATPAGARLLLRVQAGMTENEAASNKKRKTTLREQKA